MVKNRPFASFLILQTRRIILALALIHFSLTIKASSLKDTLPPVTKSPENIQPEKAMHQQEPIPAGPIEIDMLLGKIDPANHPDFVMVDERFADKPGMFMRREAYEAFVKMHQAAAADGISLVILSATRTFNDQLRIWNDKWNGRIMLDDNVVAANIDEPFERALELLRFTAMPGTSRHHWGTDIDLNSVSNAYFNRGKGRRVYKWLRENAARFGFCQPYTPWGQGRWAGYEEEKWHWSYKPVAERFLKAFEENINYSHISGFDGWETAKEIRIIRNFVLNVNKECTVGSE
ncbi:MAG TPA: M15 family metallopeptidase [Bacteroidales bacterium]|nr:M15 family metallopeptidase [Bacteroidales bacterium]